MRESGWVACAHGLPVGFADDIADAGVAKEIREGQKLAARSFQRDGATPLEEDRQHSIWRVKSLKIALEAATASLIAKRRTRLSRLAGTCIAIVRADDSGVAAETAAMLARSGHPGQVLIAWPAGDSPPDLPKHIDLAVHSLSSGLDQVHVAQLCGSASGSHFPPIRTVRVATTNLAPRANAFFGRFQEISELSVLIGEHRWVHLHGPEGIGKSAMAWRLAIQSKTELYAGIWHVAATESDSFEALSTHLGRAMGVTDPSEATAARNAVERLKTGASLVVLDGIDRIAEFSGFERLLDDCPGARLLTTGRLPVGKSEAVQFRLGPLAVPQSRIDTWEELTDFSSGSLLMDRLEDAEWQPPSDASYEIAADIVRLTGGVPRALELAAADILANGLALARFGTAWNTGREDATDGEQVPAVAERLLASVAGFDPNSLDRLASIAMLQGNWTASIAAAIWGVSIDVAHVEIGRYLDAALVELEIDRSARIVYSLVADVASVAESELQLSDSTERSARYQGVFFDLAAEHRSNIGGPGELASIELLTHCEPDIRAAIESGSADQRMARRALACIDDMSLYWFRCGPIRSAEEVVASGCSAVRGKPSRELARAINVGGSLTHLLGNSERAEARFDEAVSMARECGDSLGEGMANCNLALALWSRGQLEEATARAFAAVEALRGVGESTRLATALLNLGNILHDCERLVEAETALVEGRSLTVELSNAWLTALIDATRAEIELDRGDYETARTKLVTCARQAIELADSRFLANCLDDLAYCTATRDPTLAMDTLTYCDALRESLGFARTVNLKRRLEKIRPHLLPLPDDRLDLQYGSQEMTALQLVNRFS